MGHLAAGAGAHVVASKKSLAVEQRSGVEFPRYFTAKLEPGQTP